MIEQMITEAVLRDKFTPVLRKLAGEQDAYARRTNAINAAGNVALGLGAGAAAFLAKSVQVAGQVDYIRKALTAVEGANKAAFDMAYVDKFAQHSMFTYMDLLEASKRLGIQNQSVKDNLGDIADIAASSGKPIAQIAQLYDAVLAGGRVGLGLSARGGFAQYGLSTKELFAAEGMTYKPGQNLQNAMTPQQLRDAVHKVLEESGRSGLNEKLATTTLVGSTGMVKDAVTRVELAVGAGGLPTVVSLMNRLSSGLNFVADGIKKNPMFGDSFAVGTGVLLVAGGVMKGVAAYRQYNAIRQTATSIGAIERAGEAAKVGVARSEASAVTTASLAYKEEATAIKLATAELEAALAPTQMSVKEIQALTIAAESTVVANKAAIQASIGSTEAFTAEGNAAAAAATKIGADATAIEGSTIAAADSGSAAVLAASKWGALEKSIGGAALGVGKFVVAMAALYEVQAAVSAGADPKDATYNFGYDTFRQNRWAGSMGGLNLPQVAVGAHNIGGNLGDPTEKQFSKWFGVASSIIRGSGSKDAIAELNKLRVEATALEAQWKKVGSVPNKKLTDLAEAINKDVLKAKKSLFDLGYADETKPDAPTPVDKPDIPYQLEREIKLHQYMAEEIKLKHGSEKAYRKEIAAEVDDLGKAEKIMRKMAEYETDPKKKYADLSKADEFRHEAMVAKYGDKEDKKGGLFDKTVAKLIGGQGLSEDELLKRTGIGRRFFRSIKHDKLPPDPFQAAVKQLKVRPIVMQFTIGDRVLQELKTQFSDETLGELLKLMEQSGNRPVMGGN